MRKIILPALILILTSCSNSKLPYVSKSIDITTLNTKFIPQSVLLKSGDGMQLTITPINADELNNLIDKSIFFDGIYNKAVSLTKDDIGKDNSPFTKNRQKIATTAAEELGNLQKNNKLSSQDANLFLDKIVNTLSISGKKVGFNGSEMEVVQSKLHTINPYQIGGKYLSTYKIELENTSEEVKTLAIKDLQIISGNELLEPFTISYFYDIYKLDLNKLNTIYRINLPDHIALIPDQKITKYFSTAALNPEIPTLNINLLEGKKATTKSIDISSIVSKEKKEFIKLFLKGKTPYYMFFNIIETPEYTFLLDNSELYIEKKFLKEPIIIKTIYVSSRGNISLTSKSVKISDQKSQIVKL